MCRSEDMAYLTQEVSGRAAPDAGHWHFILSRAQFVHARVFRIVALSGVGCSRSRFELWTCIVDTLERLGTDGEE